MIFNKNIKIVKKNNEMIKNVKKSKKYFWELIEKSIFAVNEKSIIDIIRFTGRKRSLRYF